MIEVTAVEIRRDGCRYWLIAVGEAGMSRVVATCDSEPVAAALVAVLNAVGPEEIGDLYERASVGAAGRSS